jgi:hypothetical protein
MGKENKLMLHMHASAYNILNACKSHPHFAHYLLHVRRMHELVCTFFREVIVKSILTVICHVRG